MLRIEQLRHIWPHPDRKGMFAIGALCLALIGVFTGFWPFKLLYWPGAMLSILFHESGHVVGGWLSGCASSRLEVWSGLSGSVAPIGERTPWFFAAAYFTQPATAALLLRAWLLPKRAWPLYALATYLCLFWPLYSPDSLQTRFPDDGHDITLILALTCICLLPALGLIRRYASGKMASGASLALGLLCLQVQLYQLEFWLSTPRQIDAINAARVLGGEPLHWGLCYLAGGLCLWSAIVLLSLREWRSRAGSSPQSELS